MTTMDKVIDFKASESKDSTANDSLLIKKKDFAEMIEHMDEKQLKKMLDASDASLPNGENKPIKANNKKKKRTSSKKRKLVLFAFLFEFIVLIVALNILYMSVSINSSEPLHNTATDETDLISASNGTLKVNNVSITVPSPGSEHYNKSYAWGKNDSDYPSIPRAVTVTYKSKEGADKYSLSLYRQETIKKTDIPKGKNASNWFSDWEIGSNGDTTQAMVNVGSIKGFYIFPNKNSDNYENSDESNTYTFYFSIPDGSDIKIYVIEGVCDDIQFRQELSKVMDGSIPTISVERSKKKPTDNHVAS